MTLIRKYWFWVAASVLAVLWSLLAVVFAAQGSAVIESPQLAAVDALPVYGPSGKLTSFHVTAKFRVTKLQPGGTQETVVVPVEFDLVRQGAQLVPLAGQLAKYRDIADDIVGISEYNWRIAHPGPLPTNEGNPAAPTRRRATRAEK